MVAVKTHFDGKRIVIPEELRGAPPGEVLVVFQKGPNEAEETQSWMKAQESAFGKIWDNDEDAAYDSL